MQALKLVASSKLLSKVVAFDTSQSLEEKGVRDFYHMKERDIHTHERDVVGDEGEWKTNPMFELKAEAS